MIMHELAICQSLLRAIEQTAHANRAKSVSRVDVALGPLSGVEAPLLKRAWTLARAGTIAKEAELIIKDMPIMVRCSCCGHEGPALVNRLICESCKDWRVIVSSGDEMLLSSLELEGTEQMEGII